MTLATLALAVWCVGVVFVRIWPEHSPGFRPVFLTASLFAVPGFVLGLFTLRAKRAWFLFACVPLFANAMLLVLPWLANRWRN